MKKKNLAKVVVLSVAMVMALAGCGATESKEPESTVPGIAEPVTGTDQKEEPVVENAETESEESVQNTGNWDDPYDAFLAGEGTLGFQYYMDNVYEKDGDQYYVDGLMKCIPTDKEYTLKEFRDALNDAVKDEEFTFTTTENITSMGYAFLDCGADGNKELAIRAEGPFVDPESYITFVIKEIDDRLQLVYAFAEWSRSSTYLYEYGTLYGYGSGGATVHGWDEAYINADGKFQSGYYEEEQSELEDFSRYVDHDDYDISGLDGTIVVYTLRIEDFGEDDSTEYYSYGVYNSDYEEMEIPNLYTDSPYQKVMDSHKGIRFISLNEMEQIASDRMKEIGVTDKINRGASLEYTEIDFDKEYVYDVSADKYRVFDSVQDEIDQMEVLSAQFEASDIDNMPQQEANYTAYRWYHLWDDELNDLWSGISNEISEDEKQALVDQQREWVKLKEASVKEAGSEFEGGSMQPLLENYRAMKLTRKRCYELAAVLADIRGEQFQVPDAVAESLANVDPNPEGDN